MTPNDSNFPSRPAFPPLMNTAARQAVFGAFGFAPAPQPGNPEAIRILGDWEAQNIVKVEIPQLRGIEGLHRDGVIRWHRLCVEQLRALWAAWEKAGLLGLVQTYAGSYVPRFIRGSRSVLSNHAFGSAFDINAGWNPLGKTPPLAGRAGSVRELVPLANQHGFYWGGHFAARPDGMHFEIARLL
jgi:hypothetical protein